MKRLLILLITCGSLTYTNAASSDRTNNGGGLWACKPGALEPATKYIFVDFFEAKEQYNWTLRNFDGYGIDSIINFIGREVQRDLPSYAGLWMQALQTVRSNLRFPNAELIVIDDGLWDIRPDPTTCQGLWTYTQFANFNRQGQVLIANSLWNSPLISNLEKAGLIWHEAIYLWLRTSYQDTSSLRARKITGLLFSDLPAAQKMAELSRTLNEQTPTSQEWFCRVKNGLSSRVFAAYGETRLDAESAAVTTCQNSGNEFHCSTVRPDCERLEKDRLVWTCSTEHGLNGKIFSGRGRGRLEAEYRSQEACQMDSISTEFHCVTHAPECAQIEHEFR